MSEYSYLDTFIGSVPSNIPQLMTDTSADYLNWIPNTVLDAAANTSTPSAYATSRFSTVISGNTAPGSTMPANIPIPGLEIVFDLSIDLFGPSSAATFDFSASLYLQVFGVNGNGS